MHKTAQPKWDGGYRQDRWADPPLSRIQMFYKKSYANKLDVKEARAHDPAGFAMLLFAMFHNGQAARNPASSMHD
ncbi:hypothetical protein [Komagataeibacter xylinus]|uniref:Uncharacterized protein n=1 Tax=Komagataeibacter xylinus TaxID=28448 RepID=A0A857FT21_KOMXY|nr:hypothetical protein [Komagataeibacter xylinus]QHC36267.1 hypothetical protein FMA36_12835 [Komagataeibacter xylinus]